MVLVFDGTCFHESSYQRILKLEHVSLSKDRNGLDSICNKLVRVGRTNVSKDTNNFRAPSIEYSYSQTFV